LKTPKCHFPPPPLQGSAQREHPEHAGPQNCHRLLQPGDGGQAAGRGLRCASGRGGPPGRQPQLRGPHRRPQGEFVPAAQAGGAQTRREGCGGEEGGRCEAAVNTPNHQSHPCMDPVAI
jgi:hypothetical protein